MTMHLEGPWLSTTGKKKGKQKYRNADQAKKARQLAADWEALLNKYPSTKVNPNVKIAPVKAYVRETQKIPSLPFTGGPCLKAPDKVYTGTMIKGIGTMHKSNAVPIFSNEEAQDIAKMRR